MFAVAQIFLCVAARARELGSGAFMKRTQPELNPHKAHVQQLWHKIVICSPTLMHKRFKNRFCRITKTFFSRFSAVSPFVIGVILVMLIRLANLSPACVLNHAASSITHHCIITSQSRGSSGGALCGTGLGNRQVKESKRSEIHMSSVNKIDRDNLCDPALNRPEQRREDRMNEDENLI